MLKIAIGMALLCLSLQAAVVYDNGGPDGQSGNEMSNWYQAEDFTLTADATFNRVRFWTIGDGYTGLFSWVITAGSPDGLAVASGIADPARVAQGQGCCGLSRSQFDLMIRPVTLTAGTYWLALHNGGPADFAYRYLYWETTSTNGTQTGLEREQNAAWSPNNQQHAFRLDEVPEPSSIALGALGLLAAAILRRHHR